MADSVCSLRVSLSSGDILEVDEELSDGTWYRGRLVGSVLGDEALKGRQKPSGTERKGKVGKRKSKTKDRPSPVKKRKEKSAREDGEGRKRSPRCKPKGEDFEDAVLQQGREDGEINTNREGVLVEDEVRGIFPAPYVILCHMGGILLTTECDC